MRGLCFVNVVKGSTVCANSADDKLVTFFLFSYFFQKIGFDISCKLSPMKCRILFSGKNEKKYYKILSAGIFTQSTEQLTIFLFQNGLNALHLASKEGHINIVTELLKRGANVEAATKVG